MMKGVCLRYAKNEAEAEDFLQEAFIRAFRSIEQFNADGDLGAWMRKIALNVGLEMYRKNRSIQLHLSDYKNSLQNDSELDNALGNLAMEDLISKIQLLPVGFRTVFNLYAIEGFNHNEIAKMLDISVGTSKSQYSRARSLLRSWIEAENKFEIRNLNYAKGQ